MMIINRKENTLMRGNQRRLELRTKVFLPVIVGLLLLSVFRFPPISLGQAGETKITVVASTSWTGAMAAAAGADEVRILAPLELKHPPEYDYRPADLAKLAEATALVYGGYEPFIKKLVSAAGFPEDKVIKVKTTNEPGNLKEQVRLLAERFGTSRQAAVWEEEFTRVTEDIRKRAMENKVGEIRVLVQEHQEAFIRWLGYQVVGVFSAGEMTPAKVMEYARLKPDLVVDNFHNPQGKPVMEVTNCRYVELINFPSVSSPTLIALFRENASRLGL